MPINSLAGQVIYNWRMYSPGRAAGRYPSASESEQSFRHPVPDTGSSSGYFLPYLEQPNVMAAEDGERRRDLAWRGNTVLAPMDDGMTRVNSGETKCQ